MAEENKDQRDVELSSLSAIFPEIRISKHDAYTFTLELPVNPSQAVTVCFEAATEGNGVNPTAPLNGTANVVPPAHIIDSHELSHLPPVCLQISLPPKYPAEEPPLVKLTTSPSWLPFATAKRLEDDCSSLWEELGHDLVAFTYIDHVQQSADDVFGLVNDNGALEIDPVHKIAVLDHDIQAKQVAFEKGTFDCGVCLDPKKGTSCHRMLVCGHVFCRDCLQNFYNHAITEGDLASVRCLEPSCAKSRDAAQASSGKKRRQRKTFISPSELLQIPLEQDMVKKYVTLKYKTQLESDKNTIYCPRAGCQGAARSKKHKKPEGFQLQEVGEDSDSESEDDTEAAADEAGPKKKAPKLFKAEDLLAVCEECDFAFCSRCEHSWHGEFIRCTPKRENEELTAEEKASLEYVMLHTTPCPTCACPAQKTMGCNHMICYRCQTHFCYLCSAWLDPGNPYQHYNILPSGHVTSCYQRLWELEQGDGGDVDYGFAGGLAVRRADAAEGNNDYNHEAVIEMLREPDEFADIEEADGERLGREDVEEEQVVPPGNGRRVAVAREGPLVLRIAGDPPPAREAPPAVPQAPQARVPNRNRAGPGVLQPQQQAERGRARGRGGRVGVAGRGGPAPGHRPNQHPRPAQRRNNAAPERGGFAFNGRRGGNMNELLQQAVEPVEPEELDAAQGEWVRQFVRLALDDNEDEFDEFD